MFGIKTIAVSSSQDKLDACVSLGATHCINYKEVNAPNLFVDEVMKFTDGKGADYILDPICAQNF
jgi:NADPH:quinone reductase-like Zn-dependent oxidoreductase